MGWVNEETAFRGDCGELLLGSATTSSRVCLAAKHKIN